MLLNNVYVSGFLIFSTGQKSILLCTGKKGVKLWQVLALQYIQLEKQRGLTIWD